MFKKIIREKISVLEKSIENELGYHLSKEELRDIYKHIHSLKDISFGQYVVPHSSVVKLKEYFESNSKKLPKEIIVPVKEKISEIEHLILLQKPELKEYAKKNNKEKK